MVWNFEKSPLQRSMPNLMLWNIWVKGWLHLGEPWSHHPVLKNFHKTITCGFFYSSWATWDMETYQGLLIRKLLESRFVWIVDTFFSHLIHTVFQTFSGSLMAFGYLWYEQVGVWWARTVRAAGSFCCHGEGIRINVNKWTSLMGRWMAHPPFTFGAGFELKSCTC